MKHNHSALSIYKAITAIATVGLLSLQIIPQSAGAQILPKVYEVSLAQLYTFIEAILCEQCPQEERVGAQNAHTENAGLVQLVTFSADKVGDIWAALSDETQAQLLAWINAQDNLLVLSKADVEYYEHVCWVTNSAPAFITSTSTKLAQLSVWRI